MTRTLAAWCLLAAAGPATADQYWIAYEGNDFPENEGWTRYVHYQYGGAERRLVNGALELDTRDKLQKFDFYRLDRQIDPDPGELFVATWRVRVLQTVGGRPWIGDAGLAMVSESGGIAGFHHFENRIISSVEQWEFPVTPEVFHAYRFTSWDMRRYSLWIDNTLVRSGNWERTIVKPYVAFGNATQGVSSLSEWDYFRFGVVPEPSRSWLNLVLLAAFGRRAARRTRHVKEMSVGS